MAARSSAGRRGISRRRIRRGEAPTPAADLFALGLVLAEIVVPEIAEVDDLEEAVTRAFSEPEIGAWIEALVARAPGARPAAGWIAARAARLLDLAPDPTELVEARRARVRRAYLAARPLGIPPRAHIDARIEGPARAWLEETLAIAARVPGAFAPATSPREASREASEAVIAPLESLAVARWIVALVGPVAVTWPVPSDGDGALARRLLDLAERVAPEAWTLEEVAGRVPTERRAAPASTDALAVDAVTLTRALLSSRPDAATIDRAEIEVAAGRAPASVAVDLASVLLRRGETGRALAALAAVRDDPDEAILLRAEIARRRGDAAAAAAAARRASTSRVTSTRDASRAVLARLAWDAGDLDGALAELGDARGASAAEVRGLVAYARGDHERGLAIVEAARRDADGRPRRSRVSRARAGCSSTRAARAEASLGAFARAVELATRAGAVVEEATYLTGLAAAAVDAGAIASVARRRDARGAALGAPRASRRSRRARTSRAPRRSRWSARPTTRTSRRTTRSAAARASADARAAAFARWAIVETRAPGRPARARGGPRRGRGARRAAPTRTASAPRRASSSGPMAIARRRRASTSRAIDERALRSLRAARWEWWGARATRDARAVAARARRDRRAPRRARAARRRAARRSPPAARLARERRRRRRARDASRRARRAAADALRDGAPAGASRGARRGRVARGHRRRGEARPRLGAAQVERARGDRARALVARSPEAAARAGRRHDGALDRRRARAPAAPRARRQARAARGAEPRAARSRRRAARALDGPRAARDGGARRRSARRTRSRRSAISTRPCTRSGCAASSRCRSSRAATSSASSTSTTACAAAPSVRASSPGCASSRARPRSRSPTRAIRRCSAAPSAAPSARTRGSRPSSARARRSSRRARGARERRSETRFRYDEIAGRSEPMRAMLKLVDRVTASEVPVLLVGESGTGKELVARAIHQNGAARRARRS